ncbi:hypothetical protein CJ030_MR4G016282 [Morella rubra]|uniref:Uncharacterized protein n=1 Tax=Morella rubra TaxID=262757 RepID=A0A6A1VT47_9ROSI|nr:hypothetical protein CJ030_MR4G016282 [Morella rubra]
MGKTAENRICSSLGFSRTSWLCVALLLPSLAFAYSLNFELSPFLITIPILIISTLFIATFKKKKVIPDQNHVQDEGLICNHKNLLGKEGGEMLQPPLEMATQTEAAQQNEPGLMHEYQLESSPADTLFLSDSESSNDSLIGESSDVKSISSTHMEVHVTVSDVSVSDEDDDSLIEISLPESKSGCLEEEPKQKPESNFPDLLPESVLQQQGLMELLAEINEMNEEENLIEIDLSMGSIKYSRLEIEA